MQAPKGFAAAGRHDLSGRAPIVVSLAQPKMGLIRYLLGRTFYPDNEWTRDRDGSPMRPYDMATDTMFEFMGVRVDPVDEAVEGDLQKLTGAVPAAGKSPAAAAAYAFDGRLNDSFRAAEPAARQGRRRTARRQGRQTASGPVISSLPPGSRSGPCRSRQADGRRLLTALKAELKPGSHEVKRLRVGMYQRYCGRQHGRGLDPLAPRTVWLPLRIDHGCRNQEGQPQRQVRRHHPAGRFDGHDHRRGAPGAVRQDVRPAARKRFPPNTGAASAPRASRR